MTDDEAIQKALKETGELYHYYDWPIEGQDIIRVRVYVASGDMVDEYTDGGPKNETNRKIRAYHWRVIRYPMSQPMPTRMSMELGLQKIDPNLEIS